MITSIEIDGFKSLRNFKMEFRKGLNVLAGPNGSGKTNILQALELLSRLGRGNINEIVRQAIKEFGNLFTRDIESPILSFRIEGYNDFDNKTYILSFNIDKGDKGFYFNNWLLNVGGFLVDTMVSTKEDASNQEFRNYLAQPYDENYLVRHSVAIDLFFLRFFDINPETARKMGSVDIYPDIERSGSGLSEAIYSVCVRKHFNDLSLTKQDLIDYYCLLPISIVDISPSLRPSSREFEIDFIIKRAENNTFEASLKSLSDGEISWISISTALLFYRVIGIWCFDEPDRHLHPDMLRKMVSLFREHAEEGPGWLLMTTHNETVLNQCHLEEIQLVELNEQGHTTVRPVRDIPGMRQLIHDLGGQPGYHYVHGNL